VPKKKVKDGSAAERAITVLEAVARARRPVSGNEIMGWVHLPKPTVYRTCGALESMGLLQRVPDSKRLVVGARLRTLALEVMLDAPNRGPIHAILQSLSRDIGETCTFTMLDGNEVLVIDRVESAEPLRIQIHSGSRVPLHCSASGKLFLGLLPRALSRRLIDSAPLRPATPNTIVDPKRLEHELTRIRKEKLSRDNEELASGLVAIAVPVLGKRGRICGTVSVNAPTSRLSLQRVEEHVPALRRAAEKIATSFDE
jgi:DNA-binding IclR family transcriptional regulator